MDFWDLTRLLIRRWYLTVPLLLLSVVLTVLIGSSVEPDYSSKGYLMVVPPAPATQAEATGAVARGPHNPWSDLGTWAIGNAAVLKVTTGDALADLVDDGLTENVTVQIFEGSALVHIEAIGNTPEQATGTVKRIIQLLSEDITQMQTGISARDQFTTLTVVDGSNVEMVTSKATRVLVVSGGVGLLVTAGGTIAIDAVLRRRAVRKRGGDLTTSGAAPDPNHDLPRPRRLGPAAPTPAESIPWTNAVDRVRRNSLPNQNPSVHSNAPVSPVPVAEYRVPPEARTEVIKVTEVVKVDGPQSGGGAPERSGGPDETIVLPLSYGSAKDKRNGR